VICDRGDIVNSKNLNQQEKSSKNHVIALSGFSLSSFCLVSALIFVLFVAFLIAHSDLCVDFCFVCTHSVSCA